MGKDKLVITIPKPCSEHWDEMTPADRGRYCGSCQKKVTDLSMLTDREIISFLKAEQDQPVCGRFHISQVGRELVVPHAQSLTITLFKKIAASLLFFQSIVTTALAQKMKPEVTQQSPEPLEKGKAINRYIDGDVVDGMTNDGLPGMAVSISGTGVLAITNKRGHFRLHIPDSVSERAFTLAVAYTEKSSVEPEGTTILSQDVTMEYDQRRMDVIFLRLPVNWQKEAVVRGRRPQHVMGGIGPSYPLTAADIVPLHTKRTVWQKLTSPSRRKGR